MTIECPIEAPLMRWLLDKATVNGVPASGTFELSPVCNFNCKMCYVRKTAAEVEASPRPIMELADWLGLADECRQMGTLSLLLTGGEPLLWPQFWTLYEQLHKMGFLVSINTNGSLINEEVLKRWMQRPPVRVNITLYGASDATYEALCGVKGQFTRIRENIRSLKRAGIPVKINCSMTPYNVQDFAEICAFGEKEGLIVSATPYMFPPLRRDTEAVGQNARFTPQEAGRCNMERLRLQNCAEKYEELRKQICMHTVNPPGLAENLENTANASVHCRAGRGSFWITWDGWMTPCGMMPEPRTDIRTQSFAQSWQQCREKTANLRLSSVCEACPNHSLCNACAAMAYTETGSTENVPLYLCHMVEEMRRIAKETQK